MNCKYFLIISKVALKHEIDWSKGFPQLKDQINYDGDVPVFKIYEGERYMENIILRNSQEENCFKTISDFKWCVNCGGEVEFVWNNKIYGVWPKLRKSPEAPIQMLISQVCVEDMEKSEKWCDTADEVLEYMIDGYRLRDIITKVEVTDRTI